MVDVYFFTKFYHFYSFLKRLSIQIQKNNLSYKYICVYYIKEYLIIWFGC
jgi:hypothetical protein